MAELRESSGLHSLASLREHEKRRAQQRAEDARARAEAEQRARHEAERLDYERRRAELAAREAAQASERAEQLGDSQRAEFERAESLYRMTAELRSELESERAARRGVELGLTSQLLRQRLRTHVSFALWLGCGLAAAGLYFGALRPNAERRVASAERALFDERLARGEAQQREARAKSRAEELSSRVSSLESALREERERPAASPTAPIVIRRPLSPATPAAQTSVKPCRDDGDPLNPCLKR